MPSFEVKPYVYKLTHRKTGEFYIGYREANVLPAHQDLGGPYRTSSAVIHDMGFDEFDWMIVAEFPTGDEAYDHEQELINEDFHNPLCLNRSCFNGSARFKTGPHSEETKAKMRKPKTEATRAKMSASKTGSKHSDATKEKLAKLFTGNKSMAGKKVKCPHCDKVGGIGVMKRWHFDRCKYAKL